MYNDKDNKKKLAYVDFWTHKDTKSGDFLREILSEQYEIVDFWWEPRKKFPLDELKSYDYIFFFHIIFPYQLMKKLYGKKMMWAPMYDGLDKSGVINFENPILKKIFWQQMSSLGVKILKFSEKITENIGNVKLDTLSLKYYIKPDLSKIEFNQKKLNIFFWDRGRINLNDWIKYFNEEDIEKIYYFPVPDYGRSKSEIDINFKKKGINITVIEDKFMSKSAFLDLISKCNIFIAPRKKEGIGMTIVEAISKGMFVFGFNDSTMDEYIENNSLGFLFDEKKVDKVKITDVIDNYEYRKIQAQKNYDNWLNQKKDILPFFNVKSSNHKKITYLLPFLISDINFLLKKIFKINYYY